MNTPEVPLLAAVDFHRVRAAEGWLELGLPAEAERELTELSPAAVAHPASLQLRWQLHAHRLEWAAAWTAAEALIAAMPQEAIGWVHRGYAARRMPGGGLAAAWEALRPAAEKFPQEVIVAYNLSCYACQLSRLEEAREWLRRALAIAATGPAQDGVKAMALADPDLEPLRGEILEW